MVTSCGLLQLQYQYAGRQQIGISQGKWDYCVNCGPLTSPLPPPPPHTHLPTTTTAFVGHRWPQNTGLHAPSTHSPPRRSVRTRSTQPTCEHTGTACRWGGRSGKSGGINRCGCRGATRVRYVRWNWQWGARPSGGCHTLRLGTPTPPAQPAVAVGSATNTSACRQRRRTRRRRSRS